VPPIRQQELLAQLGVTALQGAPLEELLKETSRLTAEGLGVEFCKVLEYIPSSNLLLVRAGVGWHAGVVGVATVGADFDSPAGFALRTGKPVISNHLEIEERFRTSELLKQHGVRRAMNVILQGDGKPFGVLEVDSQSDDEFFEHDLAFLPWLVNGDSSRLGDRPITVVCDLDNGNNRTASVRCPALHRRRCNDRRRSLCWWHLSC
jgi:GAF domain-containing protein